MEYNILLAELLALVSVVVPNSREFSGGNRMALRRPSLKKALRVPYEEIVGTLILIVIFGVMIAAVVLRYGFGSSIFWAEEFCKIALVTLAFLGIPVGFYRRSHMHLDISGWFGNMFARLSALVYVASSITFLLILGYSIYTIGFQLRTTHSAALRIPISWVYTIIFFATAFGLFRLTQYAFMGARTKK